MGNFSLTVASTFLCLTNLQGLPCLPVSEIMNSFCFLFDQLEELMNCNLWCLVSLSEQGHLIISERDEQRHIFDTGMTSLTVSVVSGIPKVFHDG